MQQLDFKSWIPTCPFNLGRMRLSAFARLLPVKLVRVVLMVMVMMVVMMVVVMVVVMMMMRVGEGGKRWWW